MTSFRSATQTPSGGTGSFSAGKPAGTVQGDMLVLCHTADIGTLAEMGTPTGGATWSPLDSAQWPTASGSGMKLWWKLAGASEPATYGLTQGSSADGTVTIVCVQDPGAGTPAVARTGGTTSTTSISTPSTTPSGPTFEIRFVGAFSGNGSATTFTPPAGFTERSDVTSGTQYAPQTCATRQLADGGATGIHTFTSANTLVNYQGYTVNIASTGAPVSLPDSGAAADAVSASAAAALSQAATAADQITTSTSGAVAEAGTGADALAGTANVAIADAASAADVLTAAQPKSGGDTAAGADSIAATAAAGLAQSGGGTEALTMAAPVGLAQPASSADGLDASPVSFKPLGDAAGASEALAARLLRDLGPARSPRCTWSAGEPGHAWTIGPPRRRYGAGPPRTSM